MPRGEERNLFVDDEEILVDRDLARKPITMRQLAETIRRILDRGES